VVHYKKSIAFFICFVSLVCAAAHGEIRIFNKPYALSLSPRFGLIYGVSHEIVYQNSATGEYLSELEWEHKPLFVLGLGFSMEPRNTWGFFTDISIQAGLPGNTGTMEDRDWDSTGLLNGFSSHTNKSKASVFFTLDAGYSFQITKMFYIRPLLSFDYLFFSMEGKNGHYRYYNGNSWETGIFNGTVITYFQHWFLFSPGLSIGFMTERFTIKGIIKVTPLIYCFDTDDHVLRKMRFLDYMNGKIAVKPALYLSFAFTPQIAAGIAGAWLYIDGTRGDTIVEQYASTNSSVRINNSAGAGLSLFESSVYLKITL